MRYINIFESFNIHIFFSVTLRTVMSQSFHHFGLGWINTAAVLGPDWTHFKYFHIRNMFCFHIIVWKSHGWFHTTVFASKSNHLYIQWIMIILLKSITSVVFSGQNWPVLQSAAIKKKNEMVSPVCDVNIFPSDLKLS